MSFPTSMTLISPWKGQTCRPGVHSSCWNSSCSWNVVGLMLVLAPSAEQSAASKLLWHSEIHKRYGKSLINSLKILNGKNVTETLEILFETEQILQSKDRTTVYQPSWFGGTAWQQLKYSLKNSMKRSGNRNDCISLGTERRKSIKTLGKMSFLC